MQESISNMLPDWVTGKNKKQIESINDTFSGTS